MNIKVAAFTVSEKSSMRNSCKAYGKYRKSTEGKIRLCTNREIMHLCQVNEIEQ